MTTPAAALRAKIGDRSTLVGILGMGYVGLPLALTFAERGFRVLGFDVDAAKIEQLDAGASYIPHLDGGRIPGAVESGRLRATADFSRLAEADALLICVPTPLTRQRDPDLSYVEATARSIAATLRPGQLVVLESTTYPGTTDELLREILDATGLTLGHDYFLAFSPEREDPGNPMHGTATQGGGRRRAPLRRPRRGALRGCSRRHRAGLLGPLRRGHQAHGEHLPGGEHRPGQ